MRYAFLTLTALLTANAAFAAGNNQIYITQTGANYAESNQDCLPGGCNHYGDIQQVAQAWNAPYVTNSATLKQVNYGNFGYIKQTGSGLVSLVRQRNGSGADSRQFNMNNSYVTINQDKDDESGTIAEGNNWASAYQTNGSNTVAWIKQFGRDGEAHTRQNGDRNNVKVIQNHGSRAEYVYVEQNGRDNWADVVQNGQHDVIAHWQKGVEHNADIDIAVTANNNKSSTYQTDDKHDLKLYISGDDTILNGWQHHLDQYADVVITGNANQVSYHQLEDRNVLDLDIAGNANKMTSHQNGWSNDAKVYMGGDNSVVYNNQYNKENYTEVNQLGDNQYAGNVQSGMFNNTKINQAESATGSWGYVTQTGNTNNTVISQTAPNSIAGVVQTGTGGVAVINQ